MHTQLEIAMSNLYLDAEGADAAFAYKIRASESSFGKLYFTTRVQPFGATEAESTLWRKLPYGIFLVIIQLSHLSIL